MCMFLFIVHLSKLMCLVSVFKKMLRVVWKCFAITTTCRPNSKKGKMPLTFNDTLRYITVLVSILNKISSKFIWPQIVLHFISLLCKIQWRHGFFSPCIYVKIIISPPYYTNLRKWNIIKQFLTSFQKTYNSCILFGIYLCFYKRKTKTGYPQH